MLNVAILGTGGIAATHIKAYKTFSDRCQIVALCDLYPEKAKALAEQEGLRVDVYTDYREVVKRSDIDLVSVCLPPSVHAETTIAALQGGKHVLLEKPMAPSLAECDAMIEAANRAGKSLSVVAQNRYKVPTMKVKRLMESGRLGRVLYSMVNSFWWRGQSYYDLWWRGTWEQEGGGCTLNHAVHHIDLLRWFLGMPEEVVAVITNVNHTNSEVEDLSAALLRYPKGALAQLTASLVCHGEEQELVFHTEKARVSVPWRVKASKPLENGFGIDAPEIEQEVQGWYEAIPPISHEGHEGQIKNVLDAIEGKDSLLIDGKEGRATLELIMGIYKSAVTRQPVRFPLNPEDPFYRKETMIAQMPRFFKKSRSVENFTTSTITLGRDVGR
ncbi:MAG: Gfo/Idh/MocA family oxidoreductase [Spirochaetes bacterium]|nr:Gfo/Idh/MocA family oxidoreductase [Spirochaetota bacterium]